MEALLKKIKDYFKKNTLLVIVLVLFAPTAFKGLSSYWVDFKHYILTSELERLGYNLKLEETSILKESGVVQEKVKQQTEEVVENDYQTSKYKNEKGIRVNADDLDNINTNRIVAKAKAK